MRRIVLSVLGALAVVAAQAQQVPGAAANDAGAAATQFNPNRTPVNAIPDAAQALGGVGGAPPPAAASAPARGWRVAPALKVTATATNNVGLQQGDRQADVVTTVTPQLQLLGTGPDYRLNANVAAAVTLVR